MQKKHFKSLKRIKKSPTSSLTPGKSSLSTGMFYGLAWIITCIDKAITFNKNTSASILYGYFRWFLSITRERYMAERLAVCPKKISFGKKCVKFAERKQTQSTFMEKNEICQKKSLQAYGTLYCSHHLKTSWQDTDCPGQGCILNGVMKITKRMVLDLLVCAQLNSKSTF